MGTYHHQLRNLFFFTERSKDAIDPFVGGRAAAILCEQKISGKTAKDKGPFFHTEESQHNLGENRKEYLPQ
jgi:hypothetical protein